MKAMKKGLALLLAALLLTGCAEKPETTTAPVPEVTEANGDQMFTDRDQDTDYEGSVQITLAGSSASCSAHGVTVEENTVTITQEGTYVVTGSFQGTLIVNAEKTDKIQLVLQNASITSPDYAAVYILQADKVFITLEGENSLIHQGEFVQRDENNVDAAVYSKEDVTFNGSGKLTVESAGGHGIVSKDDLVVTGGEYSITAASHGLAGKDSVRIAQGTFVLTCGKDGIHAENDEDAEKGFVYIQEGSLQITAEGDGISAGAYVQIEGGSFAILAGGGYENGDKHSSDNWGGFGGRPRATTSEDSSSMKGIKSAGTVLICGGTFQIDSADDALHADTSMCIRDGSFQIASGDDAVHAEEKLTVEGGTVEISTSYEGLEAQYIYVTGGNIKLKASDDGLNAAGGTDGSGTGGRDDMFGGGRPGGMGGMGGMSSGNGSIVISGGTLYINASGDGIDANGTLEITGGHITVVGPTSGDTATLDYDKTGVISGGTFIGTGASGMAQSFSSSQQGVIAVQASQQAAGTLITLTDSDGKVLISYTPELAFQVIILSCPEMVSGETYTLNVGSLSQDFQAA